MWEEKIKAAIELTAVSTSLALIGVLPFLLFVSLMYSDQTAIRMLGAFVAIGWLLYLFWCYLSYRITKKARRNR